MSQRKLAPPGEAYLAAVTVGRAAGAEAVLSVLVLATGVVQSILNDDLPRVHVFSQATRLLLP